MHGAVALRTRTRACLWQLQDPGCEYACSSNSIRNWNTGSDGAGAALELGVKMLRTVAAPVSVPWACTEL